MGSEPLSELRLPLSDHLPVISSAQIPPNLQVKVFTHGPNGTVHQQRIDNASMETPGRHRSVGDSRDRISLLFRRVVDAVGFAPTDVRYILVWRECRRKSILMDSTFDPLRVSVIDFEIAASKYTDLARIAWNTRRRAATSL